MHGQAYDINCFSTPQRIKKLIVVCGEINEGRQGGAAMIKGVYYVLVIE